MPAEFIRLNVIDPEGMDNNNSNQAYPHQVNLNYANFKRHRKDSHQSV
jgi:hypothetical protein